MPANQNGYGMLRCNALMVKDLSWDELSHALDLGEIAGINIQTGRAIVGVVDETIKARLRRFADQYDTNLEEIEDQCEEKLRADMDSRIIQGVREMHIALSLFKDGRIDRGVERAEYALSLLPDVPQ